MAGLKRSILNPQIRENILRAFHDRKMSKAEIARFYKVAYNTVQFTIRDYEYGFWDKANPPHENIAVTKSGKDIETEVSNIAIQVVALSLQGMLEVLENHRKDMNPRQLAEFLSTAAPYAIGKVGIKEKAPSKKKTDIYKIFKDFENAKGTSN